MIATDFRSYLMNEYEKRRLKNARFSLRAFAKQLGISPSYLSQVMSGNKEISEQFIVKVQDSLALPECEKQTWIKSIKEQTSYLFHKGRLKLFRMLSPSEVENAREWYHFAILELINTKDFQPDVTWIAQVLNISVQLAQKAINELLSRGMLSIEGNDWRDLVGSVTNINSSVSVEDKKYYQLRVLEKACESVRHVPSELRDQTSMTMSIHVSKLPEARERIKQFRRELCAFLEQEEKGDEVYQLSLSLFPLSQIKSSNNKKE